MAELAMLADIQRTVYPEEVTRQLHVMAQGRESSPVIDRSSTDCAKPPIVFDCDHPRILHSGRIVVFSTALVMNEYVRLGKFKIVL